MRQRAPVDVEGPDREVEPGVPLEQDGGDGVRLCPVGAAHHGNLQASAVEPRHVALDDGSNQRLELGRHPEEAGVEVVAALIDTMS